MTPWRWPACGEGVRKMAKVKPHFAVEAHQEENLRQAISDEGFERLEAMLQDAGPRYGRIAFHHAQDEEKDHEV